MKRGKNAKKIATKIDSNDKDRYKKLEEKKQCNNKGKKTEKLNITYISVKISLLNSIA